MPPRDPTHTPTSPAPDLPPTAVVPTPLAIDPAPAELQPTVQHYDWGDPDLIPSLLQRPNPERKPWAELWMGAHPDSPSTIIDGTRARALGEWIESAPDVILHPSVAARFDGALPFLFKILGVAAPLSLQVHPTLKQAEAGFLAENQAGVPLNARERNYRDPNHKPELVVALSEFFGLRGFRPLPELQAQLAALPELCDFTEWFAPTPEALRAFYGTWMNLPQADVDRCLGPLVDRLRNQDRTRAFTRNDREYWLLKADAIYSRNGHSDRGLLSFYLLNLVRLEPGEGMYLPAGVLHAYLHGFAVELMANSNNVLRGGLTTKHVDVAELLLNTSFHGEPPEILKAHAVPGSRLWTYPTPAEEFQLGRIELEEDATFVEAGCHSLDILIVTSSRLPDPVTLRSRSETCYLGRGQIVVVPSNRAYQLSARGPATVFRATVPLPPQPAAGRALPKFRGTQPTPLAFGTSGLRGLVTDITDLEAYINTCGFLHYLREIGDLRPGAPVSLGGDLRPSTDSPDRSIMRAVALAIEDSGYSVDHLGRLPTPALTYHALQYPRPSVMVTGSHIPFDRNGIKFNKTTGEVLKSDETGILHAVRSRRELEYTRPPEKSRFDDAGMLKANAVRALPPADHHARREYLRRYTDFLPNEPLRGMRIVFYEHSAVGRDLFVELLTSLGARVLPMGRSSQFVPVDTEAITQRDLEHLQTLADEARRHFGPIDALVSTDGDSDRPLITGIDAKGQVRFFGGDLVGIVVADFLAADAAAVPVSANDAVDLWAAPAHVTLRRTRIGSPFVIDAMQKLCASGASQVVGWEANGGFLVGTDVVRCGRVLRPLPTRDAALPILAVLCSARERGISVVELFERLPRRFSRATLIDGIPPETSRSIIGAMSPSLPGIRELEIEPKGSVRALPDPDLPPPSTVVSLHELAPVLAVIRERFTPAAGFDALVRINLVDGLRLTFQNGDVVHLRPSGNAPQLRIYSVAGSAERAEGILVETRRMLEGFLQPSASQPAPPAPTMPPTPVPAPATSPVAAIRRNIALASALRDRGETPSVVGTVSGSKAAKRFWQALLDGARHSLNVPAAISFHEDLPTNQAFGILLLWQRLKPQLAEAGNQGALVAFVFGDGTRSTPFTETDNAQKPAIATFVRTDAGAPSERPRFATMVELAIQHFIPVQQYLRRSGFDGLVVKWGDELQIPTRDLSGSDPLFQNADIVRFVSLRPMNEDEAANKDWVGVDRRGKVTAFIPRRPLSEMELLADRGLLERRDGRLYGGVNLGSIALSQVFLDNLLEEFGTEVNDPTASRKDRPALDPEFFTALTLATLRDPDVRNAAWDTAARESADVRALQLRMPDLLTRLLRVIARHEERTGRPLEIVAMDFGDQYWGDVGQHAKIFEFYMALNDPGPDGEVARALAGIPSERDANGNILVDCEISPGVTVRNSVLIGARLTGKGTVDGAVLLGTRARDVEIQGGFDVLSTTLHLRIEPRGGTYKVVSKAPVHAAAGDRWTTLYLPATGATHFHVHESTDLRNKASTYDVPVLGNTLSFKAAHQAMGIIPVEDLHRVRSEDEHRVARLLRPQAA